MKQKIQIVGRFPPPIDGQSHATSLLAGLLEEDLDVQRINTSAGATDHIETEVRFRFSKLAHYVRLRREMKAALGADKNSAVLWASISPSTLGHFRDMSTVLPLLTARSPLYAVVHWGSFSRVFSRKLTASTALRLVPHVDGFIFLSAFLAESCAQWVPPEKRLVIPNALDEAVICTEEEVEHKQLRNCARARLKLLFLSNMVRAKGYLDVLEAVHILNQRGIQVDAGFAGQWASEGDRKSFETLVDHYGLRAMVTHFGSLADRSEIKATYLDADVFLLPSYFFEAQPLTIIEALNAGTPVITANHSGLPDMVRSGEEGFLVPIRDPEAIADAIARMTNRAVWRTMSKNARQRFNDRFSRTSVRSQWLDLLRGSGPPA